MLSFILTFHSFVPTRTRVWSACTCSVSLSRGIKGTALHRCSAFMDLSGTSQAALFLLRGREWLRQSVSVENLHGNKSHNLSQVCTLDWLRAITLTKKSIFFFSSPLPPPCLLPSSQPRVKLILWTFLKIFVYSLFSACECHPHPPLSSLSGTQERRLPSDWDSCQEFPMSPMRVLPPLFYLTPASPNPIPRESEGATERAYLLSVGSTQVLSDGRLGGCGWGSNRRKREARVGGGRRGRSKSGLNRARMALLLTSRGRRGGAGLLLVII